MSTGGHEAGLSRRRALATGRDLAEALRASEERYRALAESSPHGIWHISLTGHTLYANPVLCDLLEVEGPEALVGRTYHEFFTPEGLTAIAREHATRTDGRRSTYEVEIVGERGTRRPVMLSGAPVLGADGRLQSLIGTFVDITELRSREAERRRLEAQLQAAERLESLGVLAGGVAHDFNNLLTGVLGNASLARDRVPAGSPLVPLLDRIETAASRAAQLTTQLLAYAGKGRFCLVAVDLGSLVAEMEPLLRASVSKKATLRIEGAGGPAPVLADPTQLRQIVMTLVQNASDALAEGPGEIRIATGTTDVDAAYLGSCVLRQDLAAGRYAFVEVADTGCGMSDETLRRVFQPFFTTKSTGRGLALPATLGIVRSHGGTIHVQSRLGAGTTVRILFPPSAVSAPPRPPAVPPRAAGAATVLVVDDEETVRVVSTLALQGSGFGVLQACDGAEAIDVVRARGDEVALVVLDMTMPRMDGDDALRALRRMRPDLPVLLCSGYAEQEATAGFGADRPTGFLQKPFRAAELVRKVREALSH